jgi:hypothetical protein
MYWPSSCGPLPIPVVVSFPEKERVSEQMQIMEKQNNFGEEKSHR